MPPFWQGLEAHSLMSSSHSLPEKPGLQSQLKAKGESILLTPFRLKKKSVCLLPLNKAFLLLEIEMINGNFILMALNTDVNNTPHLFMAKEYSTS